MSDVITLRPYQRDCLTAIESGWDEGVTRGAVVLPTGSGKTVIFSHLAHDFRSRFPTQRVLILVHRDELVNQTVSKLRNMDPYAVVGVVKGKRNNVFADIVVASVQTIHRPNRLRLLENIGLVVIDECHHSTASTYMAVLEHLDVWGNGPKLVGVTATLARADRKGLGDVYDRVLYHRSMEDMIREGYLVDVRARRVAVNLDLDGVKRNRGDFADNDLSVKLCTEQTIEAIVTAYTAYASDRSGIMFAPTIEAAQFFASGLNAAGIITEVVTGTTSSEDRKAIYKRVEVGETQVISSVGVLTEGFDLPVVSCAVIARPTLHAGLFVQMVGRVLRLHPNKTDALVLDITGVTRRHTLATISDLSESDPRDGESVAEAAEREEQEADESGDEFAPRYDYEFEQASLLSSRTPLDIPRHGYGLATSEGTVFCPTGNGTGNYVLAFSTLRYGRVVMTYATGVIEMLGVELSHAEQMSVFNSAARELTTEAGIHPLANPKGRWRAEEPSSGQWSILTPMYDADTLSRVQRKGDAADLMTLGKHSAGVDHIVARYLPYL